MVNTAGLVREIRSKKRKLREEAEDSGIYENFGQKEVRELEDKYREIANPYGSEKERRNYRRIESFRRWAENFSVSDLDKGGGLGLV